MMPTSLSPWLAPTRAEWDAAVGEWLATVAKRNQLGQIRACTTLKERPWSLVRRITFDGGAYYFKACSVGGQCEPALLLFLQSHSIPILPNVLAVDFARKWILMADSGQTLHDSFLITEQVQILEKMLSTYAKLQIASTQWIDQLLELGLPDRRLALLPTLLESLLLGSSIEIGNNKEEVQSLRTKGLNLLPRFEKVCTELAKTPYADALDHGDFHTSNILLKENEPMLIDWGDACITHPFCSLLVTFEALVGAIPLRERQAQFEALRDVYLEPWLAHYRREDLLNDFEQALWVGHVGRALDFDHMFNGADEETLNQWRPMIFERLSRWVKHDSPIKH